MEIREIRRSQVRAYAAPSPAAAAKEVLAAKTDRLTLSKQAADFLQARNEALQEAMARQEQKVQEAQAEAESRKQELDGLEEQLETMRKCQEIARRIMRGDKVPPEDERYLAENDPEGYKVTLACRKVKKHPKEWESVLTDEKKQASQATDSAGTEAAGESGAAGGSSESGASAGSSGDQA